MSNVTQENNLLGMDFGKKINTDNIDTQTQSEISEAFEKIETINEERIAKMIDELSCITEEAIHKIERMNEEREDKITKSISNMAETAIKKIQQMNEEREINRASTMWEEKLVEEWKKLY